MLEKLRSGTLDEYLNRLNNMSIGQRPVSERRERPPVKPAVEPKQETSPRVVEEPKAVVPVTKTPEVEEPKAVVPVTKAPETEEDVVLKFGKKKDNEKKIAKYEIQITGIIEMEGRSFKTDTTTCYLQVTKEDIRRITANALTMYKSHLMELLDSEEETTEKGKRLVIRPNNDLDS
jgi:hypothetical protein